MLVGHCLQQLNRHCLLRKPHVAAVFPQQFVSQIRRASERATKGEWPYAPPTTRKVRTPRWLRRWVQRNTRLIVGLVGVGSFIVFFHSLIENTYWKLTMKPEEYKVYIERKKALTYLRAKYGIAMWSPIDRQVFNAPTSQAGGLMFGGQEGSDIEDVEAKVEEFYGPDWRSPPTNKSKE